MAHSVVARVLPSILFKFEGKQEKLRHVRSYSRERIELKYVEISPISGLRNG